MKFLRLLFLSLGISSIATAQNTTSVAPTEIGNNFTDFLEYEIQFKNTTTGTLTDLMVTDVLDIKLLDVLTFETQNTSENQNYFTSVNTQTGEVRWTFSGINLASDDEGFILFRIKTKNELEHGDQILNKAQISLGTTIVETNTVAVTADFEVPTAANYSVTNNSDNVATDEGISIRFSEEVKLVTGKKITIRENGNIKHEFVIGTNVEVQLTPSGRIVNLDVGTFLPGAVVEVQVESGAVTDKVGNEFGGIGADEWKFKVNTAGGVSDTSKGNNDPTNPPKVVSLTPNDDGTRMPNSPIFIQFSENVTSVAGKRLTVYRDGNPSMMDITDSNIEIINNQLYIRGLDDISTDTDIQVYIEQGALKDVDNNDFGGIILGNWDFVAVAPVLDPSLSIGTFYPSTETFAVQFNKNIQPISTSTIQVYYNNGQTLSLPITDSRLTIDNNRLLFSKDLVDLFDKTASVHVQFGTGNFQDSYGQSFPALSAWISPIPTTPPVIYSYNHNESTGRIKITFSQLGLEAVNGKSITVTLSDGTNASIPASSVEFAPDGSYIIIASNLLVNPSKDITINISEAFQNTNGRLTGSIFIDNPDDTPTTSTNGNNNSGGSGNNSSGNGTNTGGNNSGGSGDNSSGSGTNTGGNNSGGSGNNSSGSGTNTGGNNSGGSGNNSSGSGTNTGGNNSGGSGNNSSGSGTNTGGNNSGGSGNNSSGNGTNTGGNNSGGSGNNSSGSGTNTGGNNSGGSGNNGSGSGTNTGGNNSGGSGNNSSGSGTNTGGNNSGGSGNNGSGSGTNTGGNNSGGSGNNSSGSGTNTGGNNSGGSGNNSSGSGTNTGGNNSGGSGNNGSGNGTNTGSNNSGNSVGEEDENLDENSDLNGTNSGISDEPTTEDNSSSGDDNNTDVEETNSDGNAPDSDNTVIIPEPEDFVVRPVIVAYPSPVAKNGTLQLKIDSYLNGKGTLRVVSSRGREVGKFYFTKNVPEMYQTIQLDGLRKGIFAIHCRIEDEAGKFTLGVFKIVVE